MKQPHHRGSYQLRARAIVNYARANTDTRCWRCGYTHDEYAQLYGQPAARWTAGHINDGEIGGELAPEHHHCNTSAGASYGAQLRNPTSETW